MGSREHGGDGFFVRSVGVIVAACALTACGEGQVTALNQGDLPTSLGLMANSEAATLLGGSSRAIGACRMQQIVFTPPGKHGLPFDGAGEGIPYTELLADTTVCPTTVEAERLYAYLTSWSGYQETTLTGVGQAAELANASDTGEYPNSRTYFAGVRVGRQAGTVGIEAPGGVAGVDGSLMTMLARRMAGNLSSG